MARASLGSFPPRSTRPQAFRAVIGRTPDDTEQTIFARLLEDQRTLFAAAPDDAGKLLAVGESRSDAALPPVELAAMTTVVSAMMNFDEFVVLR